MQKIQDKRSVPKTKEEKDFYVDEHGFVVFTETFLKKRGFCCENGCKHCPYKKEK